MKILFFGNICNYAYWFAKWARMLGYDAHALLERDEQVFLPENEDPEFDPRQPPGWIRYYRPGTEREIMRGQVDAELPALLAGFDAIHTFSNTTAIAAASLGVPFVHHNVGSFGTSYSWFRFQTWRSAMALRYLPLRWRFRKAMKSCRAIIVSVGMDHYEVCHSPYRDKLRSLPVPFDTSDAERFKSSGCGTSLPDTGLTFLMPARQHWHLKGQQYVFQALSMLTCEERGRCKILVMEWGRDVQRTKDLVKHLGLEPMVRWSPMLPRTELWKLIGKPRTVVIAEFYQDSHGGGHGGVSRDAMALGAPLISHTRPEVDELIYSKAAPLFHAECVAPDILAQIRRCLAMSDEELVKAGALLKKWIADECRYDQVMPRYLALHERIIAEAGK
jgi:glycosyltransferase involved in cell wall biosynthesis